MFHKMRLQTFILLLNQFLQNVSQNETFNIHFTTRFLCEEGSKKTNPKTKKNVGLMETKNKKNKDVTLRKKQKKQTKTTNKC